MRKERGGERERKRSEKNGVKQEEIERKRKKQVCMSEEYVECNDEVVKNAPLHGREREKKNNNLHRFGQASLQEHTQTHIHARRTR